MTLHDITGKNLFQATNSDIQILLSFIDDVIDN